MAKLFGAQRLVLQAIQDLSSDNTTFVTDAQIARHSGIAIIDLLDWIETLEGEGLIEVAATEGGLIASTTAKGRQQLRLYRPIAPTQAGDSDRLSLVSTESASSKVTVGSDAREITPSNPPSGATAPPAGEAACLPVGAEAVQSYQVVLLIHGIRTQADWGPMVRSKLEVADQIEVIPIKYGYFDAFRFWFPFWTRNKPIERVYKAIRVALQKHRRKHPDAKLSVVAHSFGTYIVGQILKREFDIKIHRLILCGSVLPQDFPWEQYQGRFDDEKVINECGKSDIWPILAKSLSWGYGDSGTNGFGGALVKDRFHSGGHGQYFEPEFVQKYWQPFIRTGEYQETEFEKNMPTTPWWASALGLLPLKWIPGLLVVLVILIARRHNLFEAPVSCGDASPSQIIATLEPPPHINVSKINEEFLPIHIRNLTNSQIRLWYFSNTGPQDRGWAYYDICDQSDNYSIDEFPLGWVYIRLQNLRDGDNYFLQHKNETPFDIGWREIHSHSGRVEMLIQGDIEQNDGTHTSQPASLQFEYMDSKN